MTKEILKRLTLIVGACLFGLVLCLGMTIYTGIQDYQIRNAPPAYIIPPPAIAPAGQ